MVLEQYEVGQFSIFCYLVGDEETGEGVFIDPADEADSLISEAESKGITKIKYIVNTHAHVDHIMGNRDMKKRTGAKIIIHEEDADLLVQTPDDLLEMFHAKPSPPSDLRVKDGDRIRVGKVQLSVIHTPGHSPGGVCLYTDGRVFTETPFSSDPWEERISPGVPGKSWNPPSG